ncbi:hypothetical protein B9Z65_7547 [Elsinoe australis]|uniref:3-hydroxyisobutyrate dehydrogenase n=1 Tax=Elsinoe australis TaxID=40998 RepID=A0A2P7ZZW8_9PEZI|nr:hypothetical protein B9Z65_7547 [Elsinoe australis]
MASNLIKNLPPSTTLQILDTNPDVLQRFVADYSTFGKIEVCKTAKELATRCHTMLSSLPNGPIAQEVYLNPSEGVIAASEAPTRIMLDASTFEPELSVHIGQTLLTKGLGRYVDIPLAGGAVGAMNGTLSFMVGYHRPSADDVIGKRIVEALALVGDREKVQFCGKLGMGSASKIAHNYVCLCYNLAATEGMALGLKLGVDKHVLWKVMTEGCCDSFQMHLEQPVPGLVDNAPSSNQYKRNFAAALTLKDLRIALKSGQKLGLDLTAGRTAIDASTKVDDDPRTKLSACMSKCCGSADERFQNLDHTALWLHVNNIVDEFEKSKRTSKL